MEDLKVLDEFVKNIGNNPLYRNCANEDNRLMAALCLFFCLHQQYSFANYALKKAIRLFDNMDSESLTDEAKDSLILFNLEHAILAYSSCYDTVLQIVYFAFHFAKDFHSGKQYLEQLNRCKWSDIRFIKDRQTGLRKAEEIGLKIWFSELTDEASKSLFDKLSVLYGKDCRGRVNKLANTIKHKGGISIASLNQFIPDCLRVETAFTFSKLGNTYKFTPTKSNIESFDPKILYPQEIDFVECISMLNDQNKIIYDFVEYLFNFMGLNVFNKKDMLSPDFKLPFYCDNNGTEQTK